MLKKLREENLVTDEEVVALTEEINNATTISLKAGEAISNMLDLDDFPFSLGLLQILSGSSIMEYDYSDVSEATLVFSKDKTKARIFTTKKTSPEFDNKEDAYKALEMGKEQNVFGDTEYKKVRLEIDQCDLPATPADAKKQKEEVAG